MAKPKGAIIPGLIFLLAGLGTIAFGGWDMLREMHIRDNGLPGVALVTDRWEESDSEGGNYYWISYEFTPSGGNTIEDETTLSYDNWRGLAAGKSDIAVIYLPDDPATHSIAGGRDDIGFFIMLAVGLLFSVFGGAFVRSALQR